MVNHILELSKLSLPAEDDEDPISPLSRRLSRPHFYPTLQQLRRLFILEVIRVENASKICDIGCGAGSVLRALCKPALHLDDFPSATTPIKSPDPFAGKFRHIRQIHALDIDHESLETAMGFCEPFSDDEVAPETRTRFEDLKIDFWMGSLGQYNDAFLDMDCFVLTEVIEHLPEHVLHKIPLIFQKYKPRMVIMTTPDYNFRPYFVSSGCPDIDAQHSFPDPTGRTNRVFRHHDHRFEWTRDEFDKWCLDVAPGYSVTTAGLGSLSSYLGISSSGKSPGDKETWAKWYPSTLPMPPTPTDICATQIAIFKRLAPPSPTCKRNGVLEPKLQAFNNSTPPRTHMEQKISFAAVVDGKQQAVKITKATVVQETNAGFEEGQHELLASMYHSAHPNAGKPASPEVIMAKVDELFRQLFKSPVMSFGEIWRRQPLRALCGGLINSAYNAIASHPDYEIAVGKFSNDSNKPAAIEPQEDTSEEEDFMDSL